MVEVGLDTLADWTRWRTSAIECGADQLRLWVDGNTVLQSPAAIPGSLGPVLWIDDNWATVSGRPFSMKSKAIDTHKWLDLDRLKFEPISGSMPATAAD